MASAAGRRAAAMIGRYASTMQSISETIADASAAGGFGGSGGGAFSDLATVTRQVKDDEGRDVFDEESGEPVYALVGEYPANLTKVLLPKYASDGGASETIADWQAETTLDYNPEIGDLLAINSFVHVVRDSNEGETNADTRLVYLVRSGRDNKNV